MYLLKNYSEKMVKILEFFYFVDGILLKKDDGNVVYILIISGDL